MADIKRFDFSVYADGLVPVPNGDWVKYEDILPAIKRAFEEGVKKGSQATQAQAVLDKFIDAARGRDSSTPFPDRSNFPNC